MYKSLILCLCAKEKSHVLKFVLVFLVCVLLQEIPPYETKALMRVSFIGRVATNHTAFIRIKSSKPAPNQELLILPVEVEVTTGVLYHGLDINLLTIDLNT